MAQREGAAARAMAGAAVEGGGRRETENRRCVVNGEDTNSTTAIRQSSCGREIPVPASLELHDYLPPPIAAPREECRR